MCLLTWNDVCVHQGVIFTSCDLKFMLFNTMAIRFFCFIFPLCKYLSMALVFQCSPVTGSCHMVQRMPSASTARLQLQFSCYFSFRLDKHLSFCTIWADSIDPVEFAKGLVTHTLLCQRMSTSKPYNSDLYVIFNWHLHLTFWMHSSLLKSHFYRNS